MKLSELKKQIKELYLQQEASDEEIAKQKEYNAELEKTKELVSQMEENKVTQSQFKKFLRQEILAEIAEQEGEDIETDISEPDAETFDFDQPDFESTGEQDIDDITDSLVDLARKAKEAGQVELANQILNSAKFSSKTQFKDVEKEV
jgi:spore germination protein YaaH